MLWTYDFLILDFEVVYNTRHGFSPTEQVSHPVKSAVADSVKTLVTIAAVSILLTVVIVACSPALGKIIDARPFSATCIASSSTTKANWQGEFPGQLETDFSMSCNQNMWYFLVMKPYPTVLVGNQDE